MPSGYVIKAEIFVPFDDGDPASVAAAAKFAAAPSLAVTGVAGAEIAIGAARMVLRRRRAAETPAAAQTEAAKVDDLEIPEALRRNQ